LQLRHVNPHNRTPILVPQTGSAWRLRKAD
jgi:hypothetical protein